MVNRIIFLIGIICLSLHLKVRSQSGEQCKELIEKYYRKMGEAYSKNKAVTGFVHLNVKTIPNKGAPKSTFKEENIDIKIITDQNRMFYESTYLSIYKDKINTFTIIHPQKLIIWNKSDEKTQEKDKALDKIVAMQGDFIKNSQVLGCTVSTNNPQVRVITLLPAPQALNQEPNIQRITYYYDTKKNQVTDMWIDYSQKHRHARQEFTFYESDFNYTKELRPSAYSCVFGGGNKLLSKFRGYTIQANN